MGRSVDAAISRPDVVEVTRPSATRAIVRALRPRQWSKNALVLAAPGAAGVIAYDDVVLRVVAAFSAFCLASSAGYLVNDVADAPFDRRHPVKRLRPVAAGDLTVRTAITAAGVCLAGSVAIGLWLGVAFLAVIAAYVAVSVVYSLGVKRIAVVEMAVVASGFVLRAVAGSAATHVAPSAWFLILACSGAMFVVAGKRLGDARLGGDELGRGRPVYPIEFLRGTWILTGGITVAAYCLWAFDVPHLVDGLAWSQMSIVPFAVAILRYAYDVELGHGGAPETVFLRDHVLSTLAATWLLVYALGVYLR